MRLAFNWRGQKSWDQMFPSPYGDCTSMFHLNLHRLPFLVSLLLCLIFLCCGSDRTSFLLFVILLLLSTSWRVLPLLCLMLDHQKSIRNHIDFGGRRRRCSKHLINFVLMYRCRFCWRQVLCFCACHPSKGVISKVARCCWADLACSITLIWILFFHFETF